MRYGKNPYLLRLQNLGRRKFKLSAKNPVPETAGNTKAVVEIRKVMLEVVLLELLVVRGKAEEISIGLAAAGLKKG